MDIQDRILSALEEKGLDQKDLALSIGVAASTLNGWLKLKRSIPAEYAIPICVFLGKSPEYILMGNEKEPPVIGQLVLHDAAGGIVNDQEAERLVKLRADQALTRRIEEVAQEVLKRAERPHSQD